MTTLWMRIPLCEMHVHGIRHWTLIRWGCHTDLPPSIIHWVMPLPPDIIQLFSSMKQQQKDGISCVIHKEMTTNAPFFFPLEEVGTLTMKICDHVLMGMVQLLSSPRSMTQTCANLTFIAVPNMKIMEW